MKRRAFIKNCSVSALTVCGTTTALLGCSDPAQARQKTGLVVPRNDAGELVVSKSAFAGQSTLLLAHPALSFPILLLRSDEENYVASLMSCTHQKCKIEVAKGQIICPCHGARFSLQGELLRGPAQRDLASYATRVADDTVLITLE